MTIRDMVGTVFQDRIMSADQQRWISRQLRRRAYTEADLEALDILDSALLGGIIVVHEI